MACESDNDKLITWPISFADPSRLPHRTCLFLLHITTTSRASPSQDKAHFELDRLFSREKNCRAVSYFLSK